MLLLLVNIFYHKQYW